MTPPTATTPPTTTPTTGPGSRAHQRRRDLRIEKHVLPNTVDDLVRLRAVLVEAGHADQVANGICGWLVAKVAGERDTLSFTTRARYRQILDSLLTEEAKAALDAGAPIMQVL